MPNNTTTISSFGHAPGLVSIFLVVAAVLLTILAGLFLVAGALLGFIAREHTANTLSYSMFTAAVVLLVLIVALLLLLLWVVLKGDKKFPVEILTVLPVLAQLPDALKETATALKAGATGLNLIQTGIDTAGWALVNAASNTPNIFKVTVPTFRTHKFGDVPGVGEVFYVWDIKWDHQEDLSSLRDKLKDVGDSLKANADSINETERLLTVGAQALEAMATALGSPP